MSKPLLPVFNSACVDMVEAIDRTTSILMETGVEAFPENPVWFYGVGDTSYYLQIAVRDGGHDAWIKEQRDERYKWKGFEDYPPHIQVEAIKALIKVTEDAETMLRSLLDEMRNATLALETTTDRLESPTPGPPEGSPEECP